MGNEDYPALFRAADAASADAQATYLNCTKLYGAFTVSGAGLAAYGISSRVSAVWAALLFLAGLFLSIFLAFRKLESTWYRARAVAESVKTASWRFMMRAEPFDSSSEVDVREEFRALLKAILREHVDLGAELGGIVAAQEQVTPAMRSVRDLPWEKRLHAYVTSRIDEQRSWYAAKSEHNRRMGNLVFGIFVTLQAGAVIFTVLRVGYPEWRFWPTELFITGATLVVGWIQVKRYRELAAAYGLTAQEIGLARDDADSVRSDQDLSEYVAQTESVFSREHTQWVARKDDQ